jgi:hypothetical protein
MPLAYAKFLSARWAQMTRQRRLLRFLIGQGRNQGIIPRPLPQQRGVRYGQTLVAYPHRVFRVKDFFESW